MRNGRNYLSPEQLEKIKKIYLTEVVTKNISLQMLASRFGKTGEALRYHLLKEGVWKKS